MTDSDQTVTWEWLAQQLLAIPDNPGQKYIRPLKPGVMHFPLGKPGVPKAYINISERYKSWSAICYVHTTNVNLTIDQSDLFTKDDFLNWFAFVSHAWEMRLREPYLNAWYERQYPNGNLLCVYDGSVESPIVLGRPGNTWGVGFRLHSNLEQIRHVLIDKIESKEDAMRYVEAWVANDQLSLPWQLKDGVLSASLEGYSIRKENGYWQSTSPTEDPLMAVRMFMAEKDTY